MTQIIFNSKTRQFATAPDRDSATRQLVCGNAEGFDRGCSQLPENTVATISQNSGRLAKLEIVAPNGDTLHQFGGRNHIKREAEVLRSMGCRILNVKRGGKIVEC